MLAARAGLRVLPFIHRDPQFQPEDQPDRRLTLFRANLIAWAHVALSEDREVWEAAGAVRDLAQVDEFLYGSTKVAARAIVTVNSGFPMDHSRRYEKAAKAITSQQFSKTGTVEAAALDAARLHGGMQTSLLATKPLWPAGCADWIMRTWTELRDELLAADDGWEVWTNWYEARLAGAPFDPALERKRALFPFENKPQPVEAVNSALAALIEAHQGYPALIPEERLSPAVFVAGREVIDALPQAIAVDAGKRPVIAPARKALCAMMDDLAASAGGAQFPRMARTLTRSRAALGDDIDTLDVIGLGVHAGVLSAYARRADEFLLPEDASQLVSLEAQLGSFFAQFDEWRAYVTAMAVPLGGADAELQALKDAQSAMAKLMGLAPDLFSEQAKAMLSSLADAASAEGEPATSAEMQQGLRRSYLRTVRSALRAVSIWVLDQVKQGAGKGIQGTVGLGAAALLTGAGMLLMRLASGLPAEFGFLSAILSYLLRLAAGG